MTGQAEYMGLTEVAKYLGVARNTIANLIERGELKAVRVGRQFRIHRETLAAFLKENEVKASQ